MEAEEGEEEWGRGALALGGSLAGRRGLCGAPTPRAASAAAAELAEAAALKKGRAGVL